jgi:hypothetical protein
MTTQHKRVFVFIVIFLLETSIMLGGTFIVNLGGFTFNLLGSLLVVSLTAIVLYLLDRLFVIIDVPATRKDVFAEWGWERLNNNLTAARIVAFSIGSWCSFVFIAPSISSPTTSHFHSLLQSVNGASARQLSMVVSCLICSFLARAFDKKVSNYCIAGLLLPFILPLVLSIFLQPTKSKVSQKALENVESEFYDLFLETIFEMKELGYKNEEIPELATSKAADIIINKYGFTQPEMAKVIENAIRKNK